MRLTMLEQEFAVWVNTRLRIEVEFDVNTYARFPMGLHAEAGRQFCVDAAQILGNQPGFRDRRRAFFALCIKGVAGAENWLEVLDSGNVLPTYVGMIRRLIIPSPIPQHRPNYNEPTGAN